MDTCLEDIQDWVPGHVLLCKRFRENGKLLEFCGRSNKAGLFIVITVYFGMSRRGCIMIPASSNRASWSLFRKELTNFCSGANPVSSLLNLYPLPLDAARGRSILMQNFFLFLLMEGSLIRMLYMRYVGMLRALLFTVKVF